MRTRRILANLGAASVSRLGSALLTFGLFWWLSHRLPTVELGGFALAMGLFLMLQYLPLLGLHVQLIREIAAEPQRLEQAVTEYWWLGAPVSVLMALGIGLYGQTSHDRTLVPALWLTGVAMLPTSWTVVAESTLLAQERMRVVAGANLIESSWRLCASAVALWLGGGLASVMLVFLIGRVATGVLYLRTPGLPRPRIGAPPPWAILARLCRSTPVFLSIAALAALSTRFDMLALSRLVSMQDVGIYSAGAKLYEAALMVPTLAATVILPPLARLFATDRDEFARLLPAAIRLVLASGMALAVIAAAAAPWAVSLIYPASFAPAAGVVQVLVFAAVLASLDIVLSSTMLAARAQTSDLVSMAIGVATLVGSVVVLVHALGPIGAALGVAVHMAVRVAARAHWARTQLGARGLWPVLVRAAIATALAIGVIRFGGGLHWLLQAGAALAVYVAAGFTIGLFTRADLDRLTNHIARRNASLP